MRRCSSLCILLLLLLLPFSACTKKGGYGKLKPNTIYLTNGAEPQDLDPNITTGQPENVLMNNIFEGLIIRDRKTLEPIPGVAESWKLSKDGKTWTFKLRKNAKWSNGDPVTAHDFVYGWTRLLDPKVASVSAYQGYYIKNGKAFQEKKITDPRQLGVRAVDDFTFEATLENQTPFFLAMLGNPFYGPAHRATIEKHGQNWTKPQNMVSNGPYLVAEWETNRHVLLKKNPYYWDKENVAIEDAYFYIVENEDTDEKMFRNGETDFCFHFGTEKVPYWQNDKSGVFHSFPVLSSYFYRLQVSKPPLNNKLVRQALGWALDRESIVKNVLKAGQVPGQFFTPPGIGGGYTPDPYYPKDGSGVEKAKELLAKAGYPNGKGLPPLEIHYNTGEGHRKIAEAVQQMWKKALNINITLHNQEWKVFLATQRAKNYQISRSAWGADYNDPANYLDMWLSDSQQNDTTWSNKIYDELVRQGAKETDKRKRFELYRKAENILLEEAPIIPVYIYTRNELVSKRIIGWHDNVETYYPLKGLSLSTAQTP